ncbi:spore coat putative kinase YutH [Cytobacillus sp. Hz8]|uniref:spore coat putative kinase YutH n=1 Tax=Cytobacillus sp. Hz8 TaxID=3347168 RepID=UPI0035E33278
MLISILQQHYGIQTKEQLMIGKYEACLEQNQLYLLVPVGNIDQDELKELESLVNHFLHNGDKNVCEILKTKEDSLHAKVGEQFFCVLVARNLKTTKNLQHLGRKLAKFHFRGRQVTFPVQKIKRIGQWKQFWEQRLNQMERVWTEKLFQPPENDFERMFLESFPYYMGLSENAIQYLVDTELDDDPLVVDNGTVCHLKFHQKNWGDYYFLKNPFDWVFDHSTRDVAEWIRERYLWNSQTYQPELVQFMKDYQSIAPLSSFSWRLLYSRLLFPLHYYECIEGYYMATSEQHKNLLQDQLKKYLQQTSEHEQFLARFFQLVEVPVKMNHIPSVEWLNKIR